MTSTQAVASCRANAGRGYDHLVVLRCTRKLLRLLGTDPAADPDPAPDADDWYANLLWSGRRKCLLLTHAGTLFPTFEADVRAAGLRDTHRLVTRLIGRELTREGLPATTFGANGGAGGGRGRGVAGTAAIVQSFRPDNVLR